MHRRALLATLATTPLAGCSAIFGDRPNDGPATTPTHVVTTRTPAGNPPTPVPERPADLADDATVARYLREYERATVHDSAVNGDREVTSVDIHCEAATTGRTEGGVVGFAVCTGGIHYADGTHADLGRVPSAYYVSADRTVRIDGFGASAVRERSPEAVFAAEDAAENVADPDGATRAVRLQNFDDTVRRVTVSVRYLGSESDLGSGTPTTAFEQTYRLDPRSTVVQDDVAVREGEYRVAARLDAGPTATYRWRLTGYSRSLAPAAAVTPGPDVAVGPVGV